MTDWFAAFREEESGRSLSRSTPTLADREACRAALRRQVERHAERQYLSISRTLSCQGAHRPGEEHPTCMGNQWRSDTSIVCLCECHDPKEKSDV